MDKQTAEAEVGTVQLRANRFAARPKDQLGTCGFYPYPWTVCYGRTAAEARKNFIEMHKEKMQ